MHDVGIRSINVERPLFIPGLEGDLVPVGGRTAWWERRRDGRYQITPGLVQSRSRTVLAIKIHDQFPVVVAIHYPSGSELLSIAPAHGTGCLLFGLGQRGQ